VRSPSLFYHHASPLLCSGCGFLLPVHLAGSFRSMKRLFVLFCLCAGLVRAVSVTSGLWEFPGEPGYPYGVAAEAEANIYGDYSKWICAYSVTYQGGARYSGGLASVEYKYSVDGNVSSIRISPRESGVCAIPLEAKYYRLHVWGDIWGNLADGSERFSDWLPLIAKQKFEMDLVADPDKCIVYHFTSDKGSVNQEITVNAIGQPLPVKEHFSCWLLPGETLSYSIAAYGKKDGSGNWIITESLNLITNSTPCYTAPNPVTTPQNGGEKNDSKIAPSMGAGSGGSSGGNTPTGGDSGTAWTANSGQKGKGFITAPLSDGSQSLEGDWVKYSEFKEGVNKILGGLGGIATAVSGAGGDSVAIDLTPVTDRMDEMIETQKRERKEDHVPGFSMEKFAEQGEGALFDQFKARAQDRLASDSKRLEDAVKAGIGDSLTVSGNYSPQFTGGSGSWDKVLITGGPTFTATIDMDPHVIAPWLDSFARIIREVLLWVLAYGFVYFSMTQLEKVVFMLSSTPVATSNDSIENEIPLVGSLKLAAVGLVSTTTVCLVVTAFVLWTNTQLGSITGWTWSGTIGSASAAMGKAQSAFSQYGGVYWDFFLQLFPLDAFIEFSIAEVLLVVFAIPISIAQAAVKQYLNV